MTTRTTVPIVFLILFGLVLSGCGHLVFTPPDDGLTSGQTGLHETEIRVPAVEGDKQRAKALEADLAALDGVEDVDVCHYRGMAFIDFDPAQADLVATMQHLDRLTAQVSSEPGERP